MLKQEKINVNMGTIYENLKKFDFNNDKLINL